MKSRSAARTVSSVVLLALAFVAACSDTPAIVDPGPTPVASVAVTPPAHSLIVGQQATLQAKPKASNGDDLDRAVTWSSENAALATVSDAGVVTTLGVGEVAIRATSEGRVGRAVLTILPVPPVPVAEVRLSADDEIVLEWNGTAQITATALDADGNVLENRGPVQWQSNRTSVATVQDGRIVAITAGTATITAVIEGVTSQVGVRVNEAPVTSVAIEAGTTGLEVNETIVFSARITRASGEYFYGPTEWTSSAPAIARVAHVDIMYATIETLAEGSVTLTAARDGKSASLTLQVTARPTHDLIYNKWTGSNSEIFVLGLGANGVVPLKLNAGNVSREPSPSPDGTQLVFAVTQPLQNGGGEIQNDLYIVNRNGQNMRWLTRTGGIEDQPKWSPDGTKILFHGVVDGRPDLYVVNVDGTGLFNVTATTPAEMTDRRHPVWSPDGSRIAFIGAVGGQHKVWSIKADGTDARQVTTDAGFDIWPSYSPDGTRIAFTRYNAAVPTYGNDVMIVSAQGGAPTRLALPGDQAMPAWSPDGGYIAVSGAAVAGSGQLEIFTLRPDGSGLRLRTVNPVWGGGVAPAWITRQ
jgi:uncharacterized protein YjdB